MLTGEDKLVIFLTSEMSLCDIFVGTPRGLVMLLALFLGNLPTSLLFLLYVLSPSTKQKPKPQSQRKKKLSLKTNNCIYDFLKRQTYTFNINQIPSSSKKRRGNVNRNGKQHGVHALSILHKAGSIIDTKFLFVCLIHLIFPYPDAFQ